MIHRIYSSLDTFKELEFHNGLNILRAVKSPTSSDRHTRNRVGKSSFVAIVNLLLGGKIVRDSIFRNLALRAETFGMELDLRDKFTTIDRSGKHQTKVDLKGDHFLGHGLRRGARDGFWSTTETRWNELLGNLLYDFPGTADSSAPDFRSVFLYFSRERPHGFNTYETHSAPRGRHKYQIPLSFILGIDCNISAELRDLRSEEVQLGKGKISADAEDTGPRIGSPAELRTPIVTKESRYKELEDNLNSFSVLPEYRNFEREANAIESQLRELRDQVTLDQLVIDDLQTSMKRENAPNFERLELLYQEAEVTLPELVVSRYESVMEFHASIVENRRRYLQDEIFRAQDRIRRNERRSQELDKRYAELMAILRPHGAIDQRVALETELRILGTELESLRNQLEDAKQIEKRRTELQLQRTHLELRLQKDLSDQSPELNMAILAFAQVANQLYDTGGELFIRPTNDGPKFEVTMSGDRSKGIKNMQIFAFDMMLMLVCQKRGIGPGFLIHDSHLFDGVDERQVQKALRVGADLAEEYGFQYIVTLNSDAEPEGFEKYRIATELTDATEDGGLFGIRFD